MTRCTTCDRREATQDEWLDIAPGERPDLCWAEGDCRDTAIDWRARALAAEAEVERVRDRLAEARDSIVAARRSLCSLLDAHASPSDAARIAGHRAAMETRRGWGM